MAIISEKSFVNGAQKNQSKKTQRPKTAVVAEADFLSRGGDEMQRRKTSFENYKKARAALQQEQQRRQQEAAARSVGAQASALQKNYYAYKQAGAPQAAQDAAHQNYLRALHQQDELNRANALGQQLDPKQMQHLTTMAYRDPAQAAAQDEEKDKTGEIQQKIDALQTEIEQKKAESGKAADEKMRQWEQKTGWDTNPIAQATTLAQAPEVSAAAAADVQAKQKEIDDLQEQLLVERNKQVVRTARKTVGALDAETQALLREYNAGGMYTREYSKQNGGSGLSKMEARRDLLDMGYSEDEIKSLAEYEQRLQDYENAMTQAEQSYQFGQEHPYISTAASALMAPAKALGNIESVRGILPKWLGGYQNEDMPTNIYSPWFNASRVSGNIRSGVMQDMGDVGQFLYQAGTSALDSAVNMAASVGLVGAAGLGSGAAAQGAVANTMNWVMGSEVAADSVYEGIQNGKSNVDALIDGIVEGAIEGITEKYSVGDIIETMLSGKAAWRKIVRAFASEGAEEIASNWLNRIYDVVVKHDRGEVSAAYAKYMARGMSEGQALAAMVKDFAQEDGLSFLAGGLSGWAMSGTYAALGKGASEANIQWTAAQAIQRGEVQDVIDLGLAQGEGTKAYAQAEQVQKTVDAGGEPTQKDVAGVLREYVREQQDAAEAAQSGDQTQEERTYQNFKNAMQSVEQSQAEYEQAQRQSQQQQSQQQSQGVDMYDENGSLLDVGDGWAEIDPEQYAGRQAAQAEAEMGEAAAAADNAYLERQVQKNGYDDLTAAYFVNGNTTDLSVEEYAAKFQKAYERGQMGVSKEWTVGAAVGMNRDVATAAWAAGRKAAQQSGAATEKYSINDTRNLSQKEQFKEYRAGRFKAKDEFAFGAAPESVQKIGLTGEIVMSQTDYKKAKTAKHNVPQRVFNNLKSIMDSAVLSFEKGDEVGVLTSEIDADGKPLLLAFRKNVNLDGETVTRMKSAYGLDTPSAWVQNQIKDGKTLRILDNKKADNFLNSVGYEAERTENYQLGDTVSEIRKNVKGGNENGKNVSSERQERNVGARAGEQARSVERAAEGRSESARRGRERADQARNLSKTWSEVTNAELLGKEGSENTVRVMPAAEITKNADAKKAAEFFRTAGIKRYQFVVGQLETTVDGRTFRADGVTLADGTVLVRLDSEEYTATQLAKHEGYHIIAQRNAEMAQRIRKRLVAEGKISAAQIDSYIDAYNAIYGDNTDAYVEEIVADAYAGINRTAYGTNNIRTEVAMEAGQWTKKSGSARAPPAYSAADQTNEAYKGIDLAEDGEAYTYDFLTAQPDMTVTALPEVDAVRGENNRVDTAKVVQKGMKNARAVGTERDGKVYVQNRYTGRSLRIDANSIRHGLNGDANRLLTNARLGAVIGDVVQNAVPVNALRNKAKGVTGTYAMAAYATDSRGREFAAVVTVEQRSGNVAGVEVYDVTHALSGRQKRSERAGTKPQGVYPSTNASSKITVADFLQIVNGTHQSILSQDVLDHFGEMKNPGGYYTNQAKFTASQQRFRDALPERAAEYVARTENTLVRRLADNLSVPEAAKRETLRPIADEIIYDVLRGGEMDNAKLNRLFEQAWDAGREADTEYYEQYKDVREKIRTQKLFISAKDRADIADFNLFRKQTMGTLRFSSEGLPVDTFYQEMRDMAPELFPASITAPSDQLLQLYEVAQSIQKREKTLNEAFGAQAESFKTWARNDFDESVQRLAEGIRIAKRYQEAQERKKEKLGVPQTAEEAMELAEEVKAEKKKFQKVQSKYLLTDADQKVVNMMLRGDTTPEAVQGRENAEAILRTYEAKADYDLLALRLKAWNNTRKQGLRDQAENALNAAEAEKWVDKGNGLAYMRETMERNIRDIAKKGKVADEKAEAFNNEYFYPVHKNESDRKNYVVGLQDRIRALDLGRKVEKGNLVSESYAVQWLGEAEFNRKYLAEHRRVEKRGGFSYEEWNAAIQQFHEENPKLDYAKIENAVKEFRGIYDQLYQDMNRVRMENGYEPVDYMQGYFPHFQENDQDGSLLTRFGRHLGITDEVTPLPATINGLTQTFRPGIRYMANIQQRLGYATAYDALQGFDRYIEVASDVIYHTGDIQRLRALATQIRYRASDEGVRKQIDRILQDPTLSPDEANERVAQAMKDAPFALSNFVAELDEYTNLLAGKKSRLDRGMEKMLGRKFYNVCKAFESRVGANMVAANVGSALTNFIPITQAWSQVSTKDIVQGMWQTLQNYKTADGLDAASTFIHNRSDYGRLAMSTMDKVSEKAAFLMEAVDGFTTGSVVRARYLQDLRLGMSEVNAMQEADQFAANIMADRSKGATPTLYSARNPIIKLFTQFQLEVNNELSWIFKDMIPQERKKGVAQLAKALFKFLIGAWLYNEVYEAIVGRRAALDPLDILNDSVGDFTGYQLPNTVQSALSGQWDFTKEKPGTYQAIKNLGGNLISELPGTQMLTVLGLDEKWGLEIDSGRIAVSSAIPNIGNIEKALLASNEDIAPKKKVQTVINELANPAAYLALPFGGGQIKKMAQGAQAVMQGGSYKADNEGRDILQYPVYNDKPGEMAKNLAQALLFGKTATEEAQGWIESGFKNLSAKETAAYQEMTAYEDQRSSFDFVKAIRALDKSTAKKAFLASYTGVSERAKAAYYYNVLASDTQKAEMEPMSQKERIDYMNEKLQESQDDMIRTNIRDGVKAGTVSEADAVRRMVAGGFAEDENDAYWKIREWKGGDSYAKYDDFLSAVDKGGDVAKAAKTYLDHGVKADALASTITKAYKQQYIAASSAERKRLKKLLLDAYAAIGYDRKEKEKDIDKWLEDDK